MPPLHDLEAVTAASAYADIVECDDEAVVKGLNLRRQVLISTRGYHDAADLIRLVDRRSAARAHRLLGEFGLVGRQVNTIGACVRAVADPRVDFLTVGKIDSKPSRSLNEYAVATMPLGSGKPWFAAIGPEIGTLPTVLGWGARRVIVSGAVLAAADPAAAADYCYREVRKAWDDQFGDRIPDFARLT